MEFSDESLNKIRSITYQLSKGLRKDDLDPEKLLDEIKLCLHKYYRRYINIHDLEVEDLVQDIYLKLLDKSCSTVNSACSTVVRSHIRYRFRNQLGTENSY